MVVAMKKSLALLLIFIPAALLTVGCNSGTSSPADPLFNQGDEYLRQQDYQAAIDTFQDICDQYPNTFNDFYARERIAVCYQSWAIDLRYDNEYGAAIEKLEVVISQYPDTDASRGVMEEGRIPFTYLQWGYYLSQEYHDYESALEKFEFIVAEYPETKYDYAATAKESISQCYYDWGYNLYEEGNYAGAMEKYQVVLTQYPESEIASKLQSWDDIASCHYKLAGQAEERGELDSAIENYEAILESWPQSTWVDSTREKLASLYLAAAAKMEQESQWVEALQLYENIMNRFPDSREARDAARSLPRCACEYGRLLQNEGRFQEAMEKYQASGTVEAQGMMPECYYLWAQQLGEEYQYDEALEKYVTILNDYADSEWASWEKGDILEPIPPQYLYEHAVGLGVSETAMRLYQAILDFHPGSAYLADTQKAMVDIGLALIMEGDYGTLPPAANEGSITAGDAAVIEVRNGTPYTLLVLFKGPETKMVYLKPDPDAEEYYIMPFGGISDYTAETINLAPGEYQVGARVSTTGIAPWYGTDSFQSNEQYSQIFYIFVTFG